MEASDLEECGVPRQWHGGCHFQGETSVNCCPTVIGSLICTITFRPTPDNQHELRFVCTSNGLTRWSGTVEDTIDFGREPNCGSRKLFGTRIIRISAAIECTISIDGTTAAVGTLIVTLAKQTHYAKLPTMLFDNNCKASNEAYYIGQLGQTMITLQAI